MAVNIEALQTDAEHLQTVLKNIHEYLNGVNSSIMSMNGQVQDIMTKDNIDKFNKKLEEAAEASKNISKALTEGQDSVQKDLKELNKAVKSLNSSKNTISKLLAGGNELIDRFNELGELQEKLAGMEGMSEKFAQVEELRTALDAAKAELESLQTVSEELKKSADGVSDISTDMKKVQQEIKETIEQQKQENETVFQSQKEQAESLQKQLKEQAEDVQKQFKNQLEEVDKLLTGQKSENDNLVQGFKKQNDDFISQLSGLKGDFDQWAASVAKAEQDLKEHIQQQISTLNTGSDNNDDTISSINDLLDNAASQQMALAGFLMEVKSAAADVSSKLESSATDNKAFADELVKTFSDALEKIDETQKKLSEELPEKLKELVGAKPEKDEETIQAMAGKLDELLHGIGEKLDGVSGKLEENVQGLPEKMDGTLKDSIKEQVEPISGSIAGIMERLEQSQAQQDAFCNKMAEELGNIIVKFEEMSSSVNNLQQNVGSKLDGIMVMVQEGNDGQKAATEAGQTAVSNQKSMELNLTEKIDEILSAQKELKLQQRTIMNEQQRQAELMEELQGKVGKGKFSGGKSNVLTMAGLGALIATVIITIGGAIYAFGMNNYAGDDNEKPAVTEQVDSEEDSASKKADAADKDSPKGNEKLTHSSLTLENAISRKTQCRYDIHVLAIDVNQHLKQENNFKEAHELVDRAYKIMMYLNEFRIEVAYSDQIDKDVREKLLKVIDLESDSVEGIYQGMVDDRDGGDYHPGFRYSSTSSAELNTEDDALMAMIKK